MKFGKELASQMVPEWREAYMDYNFLKTLLKEIKNFKHINKPPPPLSNLKRMLTLHRTFSGLTQISPKYNHNHHQDIENQPILVSSVKKENGEKYETMFLMAADEGGEYELVYFRRLDDEFNKTLKFYKSKVDEVMNEANVLNKQMDALIAFRIKVDHPQAGFDSVVEMTRLASDVAASTAALYAATPSGARSTRGEDFSMEIIEEDQEEGSSTARNGEGKSDELSDDKYDHHHAKPQVNQKVATVPIEEQKPKNSTKSKSRRRPAPLDILNRITMNTTVETPRSTIKEFLKIDPNQKEMKFTRENLKKVEEQLKKAFVEFHHKLRLLKSFSFLNMLAFSKIMKKYDKVSGRSASKSYMKMVDNSALGSSDEVTKLMERVEAAFIKHFANSNRSKGMNILRPKPKRERHRTTFSLGFLAGGTVALIIALFLIARARDILKLDSPGHDLYMRTMFPLYSLFGFVVLHLIMYAINIYYWRRYRVNYAFIFGFKEGTELGYREVLLIGFSLSLLALASVLANLDMEMDQKTKDYQAITELLPLGLVVLVFAILFCPFNIIYRSSRYFLLTCLLHCIAAPLYKVVLPDFFLADQLTSQVQAFRSLQFYICYYGWGDYKTRHDTCRDSDVFNTFVFIVAGIPYWLRLLQCLRRLYDEKDAMQGYNGLKYFLTIVAVSTRTAYNMKDGDNWKITAWVASSVAVIIATYWDIIYDWGLLQKNSKNRWLRDKLLVPHKSVYFVAILLNVLLRFAWIQTVVKFEVDFLHRETQVTIWACLEIIRRGIWNFFRLENEHLNNVGKYRAFKSVPLPFNYAEDEIDD